MNTKWDIRFLELAKFISKWSKDPSTEVGAIITKDNRIISSGFNGFAKGVADSAKRYFDREWKYPAVLHAEVNAILFAKQDITNCTIYTYPMPPCARCAGMIIQSGINRIVTIKPEPDKIERWKKDFEIANEMYSDVNMKIEYYEKDCLS